MNQSQRDELTNALTQWQLDVAAIRDDPAARLAMAAAFYNGHGGPEFRYERAPLAFMRWEVRRGVLSPVAAGGSAWWRTSSRRTRPPRPPSRPSGTTWLGPSPVTWPRASSSWSLKDCPAPLPGRSAALHWPEPGGKLEE